MIPALLLSLKRKLGCILGSLLAHLSLQTFILGVKRDHLLLHLDELLLGLEALLSFVEDQRDVSGRGIVGDVVATTEEAVDAKWGLGTVV